jgi:hypothetical protein
MTSAVSLKDFRARTDAPAEIFVASHPSHSGTILPAAGREK